MPSADLSSWTENDAESNRRPARMTDYAADPAASTSVSWEVIRSILQGRKETFLLIIPLTVVVISKRYVIQNGFQNILTLLRLTACGSTYGLYVRTRMVYKIGYFEEIDSKNQV